MNPVDTDSNPSHSFRFFTCLSVVLFLAFGAATARGGSLHVSTAGNDANPGTASAPLKTISAALGLATTGDTIKVAAGTYSYSGILRPTVRVVLLGGYSPSFDRLERNIFWKRTIIEASATTTIIFDDNSTGSTVEGFVFDGKGFPVVMGVRLFDGSVFRHNVVTGVTQSAAGIAVIGGASVLNNVVTKCAVGISINTGTGTPVIKNNCFVYNSGTGILANAYTYTVRPYNSLYGNTVNYTPVDPGDGDILLNPQFSDTSKLDYRLLMGSPLIDAGDPGDPVGEERAPNASRIDIGAYGGTRFAIATPVTEIEPNNTASGATFVFAGDTVYGSISAYNDVDYYELHAQAGDTLEFFCARTGLSELYSGITVIDSSTGNSLYYWRNNYSPSYENPHSVIAFPNTGTYYVRYTYAWYWDTDFPNKAPGAVGESPQIAHAPDAPQTTESTAATDTGSYRMIIRRFHPSAPEMEYYNWNVPIAFADEITVQGGSVAPNGLSTTVEVEYGLTPSYGNTVSAIENPFNGIGTYGFSARLTGLQGGARYYIRYKATNTLGTFYTQGYYYDMPSASDEWTLRSRYTHDELQDVDFPNPDTGWAVGGSSSNALKTTDGGRTWFPQDIGMATWWQAVSFLDGQAGAVSSWTIYMTSDGGATWTERPHGFGWMYDVVLLDTTTMIAVGGDGRIIRTTDGGATWSIVREGGNTLLGLTLAGGSKLYSVGTAATILRSTDGGVTWDSLANPATGTGRQLNGVEFVDGNTGYVAGEGTLLKTTDGGASWVDFRTGVLGGPWWYEGAKFSDANNGIIFGDDAIFRTTDGGTTWEAQDKGYYGRTYGASFVGNSAVAVGVAGAIVQHFDPVVETEYNGDYSAANSIYLDEPMSGSITTGDADWFQFTAAAGDTLEAFLTNAEGSALDAQITLYDNALSNLGQGDNLSSTRDARVAVGLPSAGTYYLRVVGVASTTGEYLVRVGKTGLRPLVVSAAGAASATRTTASLTATVAASGLSTSASFEYGLTTALGSSVAASEGSFSGQDGTTVTAPLTGLTANTRYFVRVVATNSIGTVQGDIHSFWTVGGALQSEVENNNTNSLAQQVVIGDTVYGAIASYDDIDYYKFRAFAGDTLEFFNSRRGGGGLYARIELYDSSYGEQWFNNNWIPGEGQLHSMVIVDQDRTFYLRVSYQWPSTSYPNEAPGEEVGRERSLTASAGIVPLPAEGTMGTAASDSGLYELRIRRFQPSAPDVRVVGMDYSGRNYNSVIVANHVLPNGPETTVRFEYGTTTSYGNVAYANEGPQTGITPSGATRYMTAQISGLEGNTLYHFRTVAENSAGISYSYDQTYSTPETPVGWSHVATGDGRALYGAGFADAKHGFVVGERGAVERTSDGGATWLLSQPTGNYLYGAAAVDPSLWYAVGGGGAILKSTDAGSTWSTQTNPTSDFLWRVAFLNADTGYAVGGSGRILRTLDGGATWTSVRYGAQNLRGISMVDASTAYVVGQSGTVLKTTDGGTTWDSVASGTTYDLRGVHFFDADNGLVAGFGPTIRRTTNGGITWTAVSAPPQAGYSLYDMVFSSSSNGYIAGDNGMVLRTTDGGSSWTKERTGNSDWLYGIAAAQNGVYAVGEFGTVLKHLDPVGEYEPNNTATTANLIELGGAIDGTITTDDVDYFEFTAAAGDTLEVLATAINGALDGLAEVYDAGGTYIAGEHDSWTPLQSRVAFPITSPGTYSIRYSYYSQGGSWPNSAQEPSAIGTLGTEGTTAVQASTGDYRIVLNRSTLKPYIYSPPSASNVTSDSVDLEVFVAASGLTTTVEFEYGETSLYDSTAVAVEGNFSGQDVTRCTTVLTGLSSNTRYYYRVKATNAAGVTYSAEQTFRTVGSGYAIEVEPNNTADLANVIAIGDTVDGEISVSSDVDYFKFQALAGDTVEVYGSDRDGSGFLSKVQIIDSVTQNYLMDNNGFPDVGFPHDIVPISSDGTYYIRYTYYGYYTTSFPNRSKTPLREDRAAAPADIIQVPLSTEGVAAQDAGPYRLLLKSYVPSRPDLYYYVYMDYTRYNSARASLSVRPNGLPTTVTFEYGLTQSFGSSVPAQEGSFGGIDVNGASGVITGLQPNSMYYLRAIATNSAGSDTSDTQTFTTPPAPEGWTARAIPAANWVRVFDVSLVSASEGWAVALDQSDIFHTTDKGGTWSAQPLGGSYPLYGLAFSDASHGIAVGGGGTIIRTTDAGSTWSAQTAVGDLLFGVAMYGANDAFAVGNTGRILKTTDGGTTWASVRYGAQSLRDVCMLSADTILVVGWSGTLLRTSNGGATWDSVAVPTTNALYACWFFDSQRGFVGGDGNTLLRTTNGGASWQSVWNGSWTGFRRTAFVDGDNGIAIGYNGVIARTTDGGVSWHQQQSGTTTGLYGVAYVGNVAVVTGDYQTVLTYYDPVGEVEPNNTSATANALSYGESIRAAIDVGSDIDYFSFTATAGDTVEITAVDAEGSTLDGRIDFYDASGTLLASNDDFVPGNTTESRLVVAIASSGTYYVRCSSSDDTGSWPNVAGGSSGTSDGTITRVTETTATTGEYLISIRTISPVPVVVNPGIVTSAQPTQVQVQALVASNNLSTAVSFDYGLTDAFGSTAVASESPVSGQEASVVTATLTGLAVNTRHYMRVVATNSSGTTYGPAVAFYPLSGSLVNEVESNNDTTNANSIVIGDTVVAAISPVSDKDYFRFSAQAGDTVQAFVDASVSGLDIRIQLYSSTGAFVHDASWYGVQEKAKFVYRVTTAGDYFIQVAYSGNAYNFPNRVPLRALRAEIGDKPLEAGQVVADTGSYVLYVTRFHAGPPTAFDAWTEGMYWDSCGIASQMDPDGPNTAAEFEFGLTTSYGSTVPSFEGQIGSMGISYFHAGVPGLLPGTQYHFRAKATNAFGTSYGPDATLTTPPAAEGWVHQRYNDPWTPELYHVSFSGPSFGVAVGDHAILRTSNGGSTWSSLADWPSSWGGGYLLCVEMVTADTGFAVGYSYNLGQGVVFKTVDGALTWSIQGVGTGALQWLDMVNGQVGYAVGNSGVILKTTDGWATWQSQSSGTTNYLYGVSFSDQNVGIAVGTGGKILLTANGGASWSAVAVSGVTSTLNSVRMLNGTDIVVVGYSGRILRSTNGGFDWTLQASGTSRVLWSVDFTDALNGIVVGQSGFILRTQDGGVTWTRQQSGTTNELYAVDVVDQNVAVVVGNTATLLRTETGGFLVETEPNNNRDLANELTFGGYANAAIDPLDDVDYFKFYAVAGDTIVIDGADIGASELDHQLELYGSDGTLLASDDDYTSTLTSRIIYPVASADTFFVRVTYIGYGATTFPNAVKGRRRFEDNDGLVRDVVTSTSSVAQGPYDVGAYRISLSRFQPQLPAVFADPRIMNAFDVNFNRAQFWTTMFPNGPSTSFSVEYGPSTSYGTTEPMGSSDGILPVDVGASITGLTPGTLYHYRFVATNTFGSAVSEDLTFTTPNAPEGWDHLSTGSADLLVDVASADKENATTVGLYGEVVWTHDGGSSWSSATPDGSANWYAVAMPTPLIATIVGSDGKIMRTTDGGSSWSSQTSPTSSLLRAVAFLDGNTGVAVGSGGTILRTVNGGGTWIQQTSGVTNVLRGVHLIDASTALAVGAGGIILKTSNGGSNWTTLSSPTGETLRGIHFLTSSIGFAAGDNGTIIKTTNGGTSWSTLTTNSSAVLFDIRAMDNQRVVAVGEEGIILRSYDGGSTWSGQESGTINTLYGLDLRSPSGVYIAADNGLVLKSGALVESEPNNTASEAMQMFYGDSVRASISAEGDIDYYKLTAASGEFIQADVWNDASLDAVVRLYTAGGSLAGSSDMVFAGSAGVERVIFKTPSAGTYFVRVSPYSSATVTFPNTSPAVTRPILSKPGFERDDLPVGGSVVQKSATSAIELVAREVPLSLQPASVASTQSTGDYALTLQMGTTLSPTDLTPASSFDHAVPLAWRAPAGNASYRIYRGTSASGPFTEIGTVAASPLSMFVDTSVVNSTMYYYQVRAEYPSGGDQSPASNTAGAQPLSAFYTLNAPLASVAPTIDGTISPSEWPEAVGNAVTLTNPYQQPAPQTVTMFVKNTNTHLYMAVIDSNATQSMSGNRVVLSVDRQHNRRWDSDGQNHDGELVVYDSAGVAHVKFRPITGQYPGTIAYGAYEYDVPDVQAALSYATNHARYEIAFDITASGADLAPGSTFGTMVMVWSGGPSGLWPPAPTTWLSVYPELFAGVTLAEQPVVINAPASLNATPASTTEIDLSWADISDNEDGFKIERRVQAGSFAEIATVGADVTTYRDGSLSEGTRYIYRVRAYQGSYYSLYSDTASAVPSSVTLPAEPTDLTVEATSETGIRVQWQDNASNEAGYRIERMSGGGAFAEIGTVGIDVTQFDDTGLASWTVYSYRVQAFNGAGNSQYTTEDSARTLDLTAPGAPESLSGNPSGWTNVNDFTLNWTNPSDASGVTKVWYTINEAPSSTTPGTSQQLTGGSFSVQVPALGTNTVYVYLEDAAGNHDPANFGQVTAMWDTTKPQISHDPNSVQAVTVSGGSVQSAPSVSASSQKTDADRAPVSSMELRYKKSGELAFSNVVGYSGTSGSVTIPGSQFLTSGVANGVDYRIVTQDAAGNTASTASYSIHVSVSDQLGLPSSPPSASQQGNTPEEQARAYRLFSVPRLLNDRKPSSWLPASLGDHRKDNVDYVNWRFERWTGSGWQHYEEFKSEDAIDPGKAFFLVVRDAGKSISVGSGTVPSGQQFNDVGMSVSSGWNLIGNPFDRAIPADSLRTTAAGVIQNIAYFDGTWHNTSAGSGLQLRPWEGLAVRVSQNTSLLFRTIGAQPEIAEPASLQPARALEDIVQELEGGWILKLGAQRLDVDVSDEGKLLGMVPGTKPGYDRDDWFQPPMIGEGISVYVKGEDGAMERDFRPVNDHGETWDVRVESGGKIVRALIHAREVQGFLASEFKGYVIDLDQRMAYDLRKVEEFEITTKPGGRNLRVVIGTKEYVNEHSDGVELVPKTMRLFTNYPNPFNPETIIRYTVPEGNHRVVLKVYNVIGQEIATLVDREMDAGYYEITFRSNGFPSGTYIYRLTETDLGTNKTQADVKKMMLLK